MDKKVFAEILKIDALRLSKSEIEAIMEEELNKDPEIMDAELIDLCIEALESKSAKGKGGYLRSINNKITVRKALFIAAIITMLLIFTISISADRINIDNIGRNIFFNKGELKEEYHYSEVKEVLRKYDIEDVPFPYEFLSEEYELEYKDTEKDELFIEIKSSKKDVVNYFKCSNRSQESSDGGFNFSYDSSFKDAEEVKIGKYNFLIVSSNDEDILLKYFYGDLECKLYLSSCTYEKALDILKSIK